MSISGLLDRPFGNFCFSYIKLFSIISLFAIPHKQVLFYHFSKVKVLKLIIKITIGALLSSLLSAKFTRWNRLEKFAEQQGLFSNMQFSFKEGVGCTEASFTILESINHLLERGSKVFGCFLDVRKAFDTVWIDGLLFKLFSEFSIKG